MTFNDLRTLTRAQPFRPFRVITGDGTTFPVSHAEMVMVLASRVVIGTPAQSRPWVAARFDIVNMRDIVRLEPVETEQTSA